MDYEMRADLLAERAATVQEMGRRTLENGPEPRYARDKMRTALAAATEALTLIADDSDVIMDIVQMHARIGRRLRTSCEAS